MMFDYIVRKVLYGILVLWGVATIVFFLFTIVPGDPVRMMLGQRADEKDVIAIREELGLNQSVAKQYVNYLNDLSLLSVYDAEKQPCKCLRIASFGEKALVVKPPYLRFSYQSKRQVADILTEAFPNTLILASVSIFFAMLFGITLGVLAAVLNSNFINRLTLFVTTLGMSLPSFFAAILIAWLFGYVLESVTGLGMTGSLFSVDDYGNGSYLDLKNLILPALTLGIRPLAVVVELTRTTLLDVMSQDYIRTARSKGVKESLVIMKHALKNAMIPIVTLVGTELGYMLTGSMLIEKVFSIPGIGKLAVDGMMNRDLPLLQGTVVYIALVFVIVNLVVDLSYALIDPRIRYGKGAD